MTAECIHDSTAIAGLLAALHERERSGIGQVVDAAITDGALSMMSTFVSHALRGLFSEQRGSNMLDGGAPYYGVYETADARHVAIGPIEPEFFAQLCERIGVAPALRDAQHDRVRWPQLRAELGRIFRGKTRDEWTAALEGTDACFAPVLALGEAAGHKHNQARQAFVDVEGVAQPAPAPRFSRTPSVIQGAAPSRAAPMREVFARWATTISRT